MTVFEVVLPNLKKDPVLLQEIAETLASGFVGLLREAGARNGQRGFIVTEDGRDQKDEYREILLLGPSLSASHLFISSYCTVQSLTSRPQNGPMRNTSRTSSPPPASPSSKAS